MVYVRRDVVINEVSLCRDPVNPKARVALFKSRDPEPGIRGEPGTVTDLDGAPRGPPEACDYWQALINEKAAAAFLGVEGRTLQSFRQRGFLVDYRTPSTAPIAMPVHPAVVVRKHNVKLEKNPTLTSGWAESKRP